MLRRLSDVTFGSIEKFLNINGGSINEKEKKRKFTDSNAPDKENKVIII